MKKSMIGRLEFEALKFSNEHEETSFKFKLASKKPKQRRKLYLRGLKMRQRVEL
jgi:hypothetical protein